MSEVGFHLVVVGTIFQTPTADRLEVLNDVVVSVDRDGVISLPPRSWNHDRRVLLLDSRRGNAPVSKNLCRNWSTRFRRTSGHGPSRGHTSLVPRYQRS